MVLGRDKIVTTPPPPGKKKEGALDGTQEQKDEATVPPGGNINDSPVISEAGDEFDEKKLDASKKPPESGEKDKEKEKKEEPKKPTLSKEELDKQAENDAIYKRKVMEEVTNLARKMSREEIEEDKKDSEKKKKDDKKQQLKRDKAFSPILKEKSPEHHKSKSDSRKKRKKTDKIREEINGGKKPEYIKQEDDHAADEQRPHPTVKRTGGAARTPGQEHKDDQQNRKRDESEEIILQVLRENKEQRSGGRQIRAPHFDELEHPRLRTATSVPRRGHDLIRPNQKESPNKSGRQKKVCDPSNDKTAPMTAPSAPFHPPSSEGKNAPKSSRYSQAIIIILSLCLFASLIVIIIQTAFIAGKCGLRN